MKKYNPFDRASVIENKAVKGLLGTENSLAYKVHEIEKHLHSGGRWWGSNDGDGDSPAAQGLLPFKVIASDTQYTFGTVVEIFAGSENWNYGETITKFDPHEIFVVEVGKAPLVWKLRLANSGWNGSAHTYADMAAAVTAGKYSDVLFKIDATNFDAYPFTFQSGRINIGSKVWCQVMNSSSSADNDAARTIQFFLGAHGYIG